MYTCLQWNTRKYKRHIDHARKRSGLMLKLAVPASFTPAEFNEMMFANFTITDSAGDERPLKPNGDTIELEVQYSCAYVEGYVGSLGL